MQDGRAGEDVVEDMLVGLTAITTTARTEKGVEVISEWQETYDAVAEKVHRVKDKGQVGWSTGIDPLDKLTGGPQPGQLWLVGARLGHGNE